MAGSRRARAPTRTGNAHDHVGRIRISEPSRALITEVKGFNAVANTPGVTISESTLAVTEVDGATDTYTVVLDTGVPTGDVTIAVTETSPDISLSATTLTFGTANWSNAQTVTVTARGRLYYRIRGDRHHHALGLGHSRHQTDYPTTLTVDSVSVTVTNNDATPPGAPVLTAAAKDESIELTWTLANHGQGSNITRASTDTGSSRDDGRYLSSYVDRHRRRGVEHRRRISATIGSLTNGTQYTVQVRGVNVGGRGRRLERVATATPDAPPETHGARRDHLDRWRHPASRPTRIGDDIELATIAVQRSDSGPATSSRFLLELGQHNSSRRRRDIT